MSFMLVEQERGAKVLLQKDGISRDVNNCPICGRIFMKVTKNYCDKCVKKEEEQFRTSWEYAEEHPKCSAEELAEATGVPIKRVLAFVREGRLFIASDALSCAKCGAAIPKGNFCAKCSDGLLNEMKAGLAGSRR